MTQMPCEWQTAGDWLAVRLIGIPLFGIILASLSPPFWPSMSFAKRRICQPSGYGHHCPVQCHV